MREPDADRLGTVPLSELGTRKEGTTPYALPDPSVPHARSTCPGSWLEHAKQQVVRVPLPALGSRSPFPCVSSRGVITRRQLITLRSALHGVCVLGPNRKICGHLIDRDPAVGHCYLPESHSNHHEFVRGRRCPFTGQTRWPGISPTDLTRGPGALGSSGWEETGSPVWRGICTDAIIMPLELREAGDETGGFRRDRDRSGPARRKVVTTVSCGTHPFPSHRVRFCSAGSAGVSFLPRMGPWRAREHIRVHTDEFLFLHRKKKKS